ncbi:methyltransferase domain-containing protein [Colletotrichum plurivorum]|uniref:Methyltransferase domain-containing protein n=1 Tax=Colletotrichum plurivorum TaxID=2175906 RepID=A0A8H6NE24_9PEZI|nr:methyltransferase domain-containing protein [Colletotrichum plurivorum]
MNATNGATALDGPKGQQQSPYLTMIGDAEAELERLRIQHRWLQMCLGDRIAFAPVDFKKDGLKVLDMGCADGTLLRDLQKQVPPSAEMVGADVSTVFLPSSSQGNIRYVTQDICDPPADELKGKFDFTHVRNVLHSSGRSGVEKAVENLVNTLAPGGWVQAMEMDMNSEQCEQPQAMQDAIRVISTMMEKAGMDPAYQKKLPEAFKKAGLQNVTLERVNCGIGKAHSNQADLETSIAPFRRTIPLVTKTASAMCPELPPSVYENLEERYVKDMTEKGGFFPAIIVYGQKPMA